MGPGPSLGLRCFKRTHLKTMLPPTFTEGFHDPEVVKRMQYRELGKTGMKVSLLSLGASSLGSVFRDTTDEESVQVVHQALKHGINLIDTAPWYGHGKSERVLGQALKGIPRQAYYLTTKVGRYLPAEEEMFDFRAERVTRSVYESLERLGLDYIDVIQVHDPEFAPSLDIILHETLPALHRLKEKGVVRFIGITGYPLAVLERQLREAPVPIDTCLSYCHYSMNDTTLLRLLPLLEEKGVGLINASPLSMGLLTKRGPPAWHPATAEVKRAGRAAAEFCKGQGVDIAKLALHFTLHTRDDIPTTLVSTASVTRLLENIQAVHETLTPRERELTEYCIEHFFAALAGREAWEGVEVAAYWEAIGKRYILRTVYGKEQQPQPEG